MAHQLDNGLNYSYRIYGLQYEQYTSDEILKLSSKEITNPVSVDLLLNPNRGGLYDPELGTQQPGISCEKCGLPFSPLPGIRSACYCSGHMGHISFPLPVFNPINFQLMFQILRSMCFNCGRLLRKRSECLLFLSQMEALDSGLITAYDEMTSVYKASVSEFNDTIDSSSFYELKNRLDNCLLKENPSSSSKTKSETTTKAPSLFKRTKHIENVRKEVLKNFFSKRMPYCYNCKRKPRNLRHDKQATIYFTNKAKFLKINKQVTSSEDRMNTQDILSPTDCQYLLRKLYTNHPNVLNVLCGFSKNDKRTNNNKIEREDGDNYDGDCHDGEVDGDVIGGGKPCPMDTFFLENMLIIPPRYRPMSKFKFTMVENPESMNLKFILNASNDLRSLIREEKIGSQEKKTTAEDLHRAWFVLQTRVNAHLDQGLCRIFKDSLPGVKQTIEKKEGLLRKNMMGKRVNSAARSVISPDPYLDCNQVGIPVEFAKRLMFSEVVHPRNFEELREAVINGPDEYPGAYSVQLENDQLISLHAKTRAQREAIANQLLTPTIINGYPSTDKKKVKRHLKTGDKMILNRQPTLHKPSMQTFSARVLPMEKTIRINYTPCKAFNADFDGDEMNAHFPQNEVARAEAFVVACAEEQYLVPKDGKPIAGLIQDHMVSGVLLTVRGRFFHRMQYQQLVYAALSNSRANIKLLRPSVYRPVCLWSGKQVLSTLLLNVIPDDKPALSLKGKSKISDQEWINDPDRSSIKSGLKAASKEERRRRKKLMEQVENRLDPSYPFMSESDVLIVDGELLQGVLDKNHYGASAFGLVHWCYELYGGEVSSRLLTCLGRLFTYFLRSQHSFTMGVEDIIITEQGDEERMKKIKEVKECGQEVVARAMQLPAWADPQQIVDGLKRVQFSRKRMDLLELDGAINTQMTQLQDKIKKSCWPQNLIKSFPSNNLTLMVQSGAKGSVVNCMQISCLLGQVDLEGCRPPVMISGATLPSFKPYDLHPRAGGFIDNRFLTGLNVQEYFFHCMAGRDGLVDTAVKTSRSGYLQRCLIKHLEGLTSAYDETVRDSDGSIIQFKYGEDGLDVMRTSFLDKKQFSQLIENQYSIVNEELEAEIFSKINTVDALQHHLKMEEWRSTHENFTRKTAFQLFSERHWDEVRERMIMTRRVQMDGANQALAERQLGEICKEELSNMFDNMNDKQSRRLQKKLMTCPDPVSSILPASRYLGCTSQHFHDVLEEYIKRDDNKVLVTEKQLKKLMKKYNPSSSSSFKMRHPYKITTDDLKKMMYLKYQRSLIQPGEAVGILAATSMGEQTTQMTLNTFHFAGHGAMNVTLGIPRLREILMVASKDIKTPMMMVPLLSLGDKAERRVNKFIKKFRRVPLEKVLSSAVVKKTLIVSEFKKGHRLYKVRFNVAPHSLYKDDFNLNPAKILNYLESKFMGHLARVIEKQERELVASSLLNTKRVSVKIFKKKSGGGDDDDGNAGDDDDNRADGGFDDDGGGNGRRNDNDDDGDGAGRNSDDDDDDDDAAAADDDNGDDGERKRRADQDADEEEDDDDGDDDDDDGGNEEGSGDDDGDEDGEEDGGEKADENSEKKKPTKNRSKNNEDDDDDDDDDNNKNNNINGGGGDNDDEMTEKKKTKRRKVVNGDGQKEIILEEENDDDENDERMAKRKIIKMDVDRERVEAVCSKSHVIDYVYDVQDNMWGEVTFKFELAKKEMDIQWLVDNEIKRTVINQVANISNCIMKEIDINDSPAYMFESALNELERMTSRGLLCGRRKKLQVEGLNIQEMYKYQDKLCVDELYCNNIQAIALNYGIEAASQVIIEEIRQVFKAYGIDVDYRHLSLIADYMTYEGSFRPFNRLGLDSNASTLQKMSFESALNYLKKSIVDGSYENAESPSACLILGKPIKTGTGSFDLVVPVS